MLSDCFKQFVLKLEESLQMPLPGFEAQMSMAPPSRKNYPSDPQLQAKSAATLSLFFPVEQDIRLLFIVRQNYQGVHSGQISFPGGAWEPEDKSFMETALRETYEETGIQPNKIKILGKLTPLYVPPSNFLVHPFVGSTTKQPDMKPDPGEVSELFTLSVFSLMSDNCRQTKSLQIGGKEIGVPCFNSNGRIIWGATAMILNELIEVIKRSNYKSHPC